MRRGDQPKYPSLTPLRAFDLLLLVVEKAGQTRGSGHNTSHATDRTIRELTDHVKAALVRGRRKR